MQSFIRIVRFGILLFCSEIGESFNYFEEESIRGKNESLVEVYEK